MAQVNYTPKFKQVVGHNPTTKHLESTDIRPYISQLNQYWDHRQHKFGHCLHNDTNDIAYVNIPKNATNWAKDNLTELGWYHANFNEWPNVIENKKVIVILRDPIERWLSGIAEYFVWYHRDIRTIDQNLLDIIFNCVTFDDHTEKQGYFLNGINVEQLVFFKCDSNLRRNLGRFLRINNIPNTLDYSRYVYATDEHSPQYFYKTLFTNIINTNPRYLEQLKKHFEKDIKLYNTVTFYG